MSVSTAMAAGGQSMATSVFTSSAKPGWGDSQVQIVSAVPGRMRLRVSGMYRNQAFGQRLQAVLGRCPEMTRVSFNAVTCSLLLTYQPRLQLAHIRQLVEQTARTERGLSQGDQSKSQPSQPSQPSHGSHGSVCGVCGVCGGGGADSNHGAPWHALTARAALRLLDSQPTAGLAPAQVRARQARHGPNRLPQPGMRPSWSMLVEQFANLPVALLMASAVFSLLTRARLDAAVITGVVAINGLIGFRTEQQAERIISGLQAPGPQQAVVRRDHKRRCLEQQELVPGDILLLSSGDFIAADARLLTANHLRIDESALTGESQPVRKHATLTTAADARPSQRANMVFMGTRVTGGNAVAVVVGTASCTELGRIQRLAEAAGSPRTPMQRELERISVRLVYLGLAVGALSLGISLLRGRGTPRLLRSNITLAVAAIPEGLPTVANSTLALGVRRLRRRHAAVRRIDAVESLGAITALCLDKTGTLTANRMLVTEIRCGGRRLQAEQLSPALRQHDQATHCLLRMAALCNDSTPQPGAGWEELRGSATESALVGAALQAGMDVAALRRGHPRIGVRYRAEQIPYMVTLHRPEDGRGRLIAVKGNPVSVLKQCAWQRRGEAELALDGAARAAIIEDNRQMAAKGLRVLGVACALDTDEREINAGLPELVWLGLIGMSDPIRAGVESLIHRFHGAGIRTIMITGDQPGTAAAVGRQLHLRRDGGDLKILDVAQLARFGKWQLQRMVRDVDVFARVSPADKLSVVRALQQSGEIVAMTGDGINDGPALKAADIGIALGRSGTEAARSMADMVIEDDNLDTILSAVEGGRTIYSNIRKAIIFLLSTNMSEIQLMLAGIFLDIGRPLSTMQLLWINLITDIFPSLALGQEAPEAELLKYPPRPPRAPIVDIGDLQTMGRESAVMAGASLAAYMLGRLRSETRPGGHPGNRAGTYAFMTLTMSQLLHAYACRSETESIFRSRKPGNRPLDWAVGGSLVLQLLVPLIPALRRLLGVVRIGPAEMLLITLLALAPLLINESLKPDTASS